MPACPSCGEDNPAKFRLCGFCGAALAAAASLPAHEVRKTVTIVFADLVGSTALGERLDAEALHEVKRRYFDAMAAEIARHGGKVEKYIGDAIMAVFGLPRAHEDDALRAVRAAAGMQAALVHVNDELRRGFGVTLACRTGIDTGDVVATDDPSATQRLATGDAVNVAARLEQAAPPGQIYLGEPTWRLVRDAVEVEAVAPLALKGKSRPVAAYRLISAQGIDGYARRHDMPLVGRDDELALLAIAYAQACERRRARLVTVLGDAGAGKSRLVQEAIERVPGPVRVLRGRCLPYGDGITFWPLRMMLCEAADIRADDDAEVALRKTAALVGADDVAARLASAAGWSAAPFPLGELNWAARRFLETLAASAPVVALIDDIHWAEPAFLDLIEHVLEATDDAPLLLLATARHDLLEERPQWPDGPRATQLALRPLSDAASAQVVTNLLGGSGLDADTVARIVAAADGNPLFVEQMLAMVLIDGEVTVPPTIQALLEARLDRLSRAERMAVEPASVIGLEFPQAAVEALAPEAVRASIGEHLASLSRRRFVQPAPRVDGEAAWRFHHQLVRDTVYNGLLKRARAQLHAEFVRWVDGVTAASDRALEFQEILGYHLEQAHRCLRELGPLDARGQAIGADAARRLAAAGRRAFARGDMNAAANLFRRAVALLGEEEAAERAALLRELGETLIDLGDFDAARSVLDDAVRLARRLDDTRLQTSAGLIRMLLRLYSGEPGDWSEATLRAAHDAIALFEREGAASELATAWRLVAFVHGLAGSWLAVGSAVTQALDHARAAGNARLVARCGMSFSTSALLGPAPVREAIAGCERLIDEGVPDRQVESIVLCTIAQLRAMRGEFDAARRTCARGRALVRDLGPSVNAASTGLYVAHVEWLAGDDLAGAERAVRADLDFLQQRGETYFLPTLAALLARIVRDQGRDADALPLLALAEQVAADDDVEVQALWRSIRAPIAARGADTALAESLARTAVELAQRTEMPTLQADTLAEAAVVSQLCGRGGDARRAADQAIGLYESKGDLVSAARVSAWLGSLRSALTS